MLALQQDLDSLVKWLHSWLMTFDPQKHEFLRITNKKNPIIHNYYTENSLINKVPHTKYLGVTIDYKLSLNEHNALPTKLFKPCNTFLYQNLRHCPINIKCTSYKSIIWFDQLFNTPHLSGTIIPSIINISEIKAIQRAAAKFCFNDHPVLLLC